MFVVNVLVTVSDKLYSCGGWIVSVFVVDCECVCESVFVVDVLVTGSDKLYSCGGWIVSLCLW